MSKTKQKQLILDVISKKYTHPGAYDIYEECRKILPNISLGTVYRNLNTLVMENKIKNIGTFNNILRFDRIEKGKEHAHFICIKCNEITDIFEEVCIPKNINDNLVMDYELTIKGICKQCQTEEGVK